MSAIANFLEISDKLGDDWKKEGDGIIPGATFISLSCLKESSSVEERLLKCEYHVVYSMSYSVPVIYFNMSLTTGKLLPVEQVWSILQDELNSGRGTSPSVSSIISQQEHPILNVPYLFLHPCHTEALMKSLSSVSSANTNNSCEPDLHYLLSWLSIVGRVVGLPLCNEYGKVL